jgi:outer membrane protein
MKRIFLIIFAVSLLFSNTAMAESIAGKFGITARGGAGYFLNSEFTDASVAYWGVDKTIKGGPGWTGGGGLMYGITDNLSVDFDIIYGQVDVTGTSSGGTDQVFGEGKTVDFSFGAQWRFAPKRTFVPYAGAGVDFLINSFSFNDAYSTPGETLNADNTYGGHLNIGADYFVTPKIALNAEFRYLYSTKGDMIRKYPGETDVVAATYNPSNISGFAGIRFFFP